MGKSMDESNLFAFPKNKFQKKWRDLVTMDILETGEQSIETVETLMKTEWEPYQTDYYVFGVTIMFSRGDELLVCSSSRLG
jgi:hypothetical protein